MNGLRIRCIILASAVIAGLLWSAPGRAGTPRFAAVDAQIAAMLATYRLPGAVLLVAHNGVLVKSTAYGSYSVGQRLPIASASKWITATVLQRLVDQGVLDWDRAIGEYSAQVPAGRADITLRQLMALTSGVPGGTAGAAASCLNNPLGDIEACAQQILQLPAVGRPGEVFDYGANAMQVAAWIAEEASGATWEQLFREQVAAPLGWVSTDYGVLIGGAVANPRVASSVYSTAPEYLQLLLFQQGFGRHQFRRLLGRASSAEAHRLQTGSARVLGTPYPEAKGYALGRWVDRVDAQGNSVQLSSPGAYGFTPWIDLQRGIAAVFAVQSDLGGFTRMRGDLFQLQSQVAAAIAASSAVVPFADFAGVWWNPAESGAGLILDQNERGQLVLSWYTFADDGSPLWLVGHGAWRSADVWEGVLFRANYRGRDALRRGLDPAAVETREFGQATLHFTGHSVGSVRLRTPEFERQLPIERLAY